MPADILYDVFPRHWSHQLKRKSGRPQTNISVNGAWRNLRIAIIANVFAEGMVYIWLSRQA